MVPFEFTECNHDDDINLTFLDNLARALECYLDEIISPLKLQDW